MHDMCRKEYAAKCCAITFTRSAAQLKHKVHKKCTKYAKNIIKSPQKSKERKQKGHKKYQTSGFKVKQKFRNKR